MTTLLIAALIVTLLVSAATAIATWLAEDGGPRPSRFHRAQDSWSSDLPTRPYALR
ncbi:MAG TPA: hypothetical protein VJ644_12980 [Jiangellaceae bacterium]|nr:hypothetical protein [Jiangellaceae bacterium]